MKRQRAVFLGAALLLGLVILSAGCGAARTTAQAGDRSIPVEVAPATRQTLIAKTAFSGKVYSDQEVALTPKIPGKVSSVRVKVGDQVRAGTVLLTLDPQDLQRAVDLAELGVRSAEANYQRTKEQIDLAKKNLERQRQLYAAGIISQAQLESFESQASETPLQLAQIQWDQAKLSLQQARDALSNAAVLAPMDAAVAAVNVKAGEIASNVQPAVTLTDTASIYVALAVPENIVASLKAGQEAKVAVLAAGVAEVPGHIASIAPSADSRTQLYSVKVALANQDGAIKPGMFARVEMPTETQADVLAIKSEAIVVKNGKNTVYVVEDGRAAAKEVVAGLDTGEQVEIIQGLKAGDQVIVKGQTLVEQGGKVRIVGGSAS